MKYLSIIMLIISLSNADQDNGKEKKNGPLKQKKQFVNFINDDGEYARNYVDVTNNEGGGFDDIFRGRGNGMAGGSLQEGAMQLTENSMGGLALDGDDMEPSYNQLSPSQLNSIVEGNSMNDQRIVHIYPALRHRHHLRRLFICRGNSDLPWSSRKLRMRMRCASSAIQSQQQPQQQQQQEGADFSQDGLNYQAPSFFGTFDVNTGSQDLLSPFYSSEGKLEDNINLSDTMNNNGQIDMTSFNEALQGMNNANGISANNMDKENLMKVGGKNKPMTNSETLNGELGEMESSDEKLQKLLEASIASANSNSNENSEDAVTPPSVGSLLNALLSQQGVLNGMHNQHVAQQQQQQQQQQLAPQDEAAGVYEASQQEQQMQQSALNQLSGTMAQNGMGSIQPITVHVHASDKPGHALNPPPIPDASRAVAQQAQETAMKQHKSKLAKLKKRLALLREKLTELEDEQAKKSTSNKSDDPKQERNDAIKKLLIKNLRLAALIATKEIQLEEAKSRGLEYMSGKKEDVSSLNSMHDVDQREFPKSKPLTELSRKAEDEVNHLSITDRLKSNNTFFSSSSPIQNDTLRDKKLIAIGKNTLNRINATLQELDNSTPVLNQRSLLTATSESEAFLDKLRAQIHSMSSDQVHAMEARGNEKSLARELLSKKDVIQEIPPNVRPPSVIIAEMEDP